MDLVPPSYQSATTRDAWSFIAGYIPSSDLCAATLVCRKWHALFMPFLWGDPASHFGTDNDAVYGNAIEQSLVMRTLKYARLEVRMLTHTLHLPPALSEIYGGPRPEWLGEILEYLPGLQSLIVSKLPFFDHNSMVALKSIPNREQSNEAATRTYNVRLLLADHEPNTTSQGLAEALLRFQELIYLDLSYTTPARDRSVLSAMSQLEHLQVLKLRGIGLKDSDAEFLANAIGLRVRYLDLRDNKLTDMAVRSLLQACFLSPGNPVGARGQGEGTIAPSSPFAQTASPRSNLKWMSCPTLDEQFMKALTQPLTGRSWVENVAHVGITHLYIADNRITVEGVASLLASYRLHALDVGTVDTTKSIWDQCFITPYHENPRKLPGAEKLIPTLGSAAKGNLTYLRAHHAVCTADAPCKSPNDVLAELPAESEHTENQASELDATNVIHELHAEEIPIFELPGSPVPQTSRTSTQSQDEPLPRTRRVSVFAPEVVETTQAGAGDAAPVPFPTRSFPSVQVPDGLIPTELEFNGHSETLGTSPICASPVAMDDPKAQKIQELLFKRPKNSTLPRKYNKESFPYLHPSHVPHLETLVLTDVPSHVPANSPILRYLTRFIAACSDEALLATLQAGSDYSLPPGRARAKAEQERSRSLFALRRLILEVTPVERNAAKLTAWRSLSYQQGTQRSSTGDRDSEKLWAAAVDDFSFFGEEECGVPQHDPGKYFPMAVLNEKVTLIPDDDSGSSGNTTPVVGPPKPPNPNVYLSHGRDLRSNSLSLGQAHNGGSAGVPQLDTPEVDLVAELAAFRRSKKAEYEELLHREWRRRSTNGTTFSLLSPSVSISSISTLPSLTSLAAVSAPQMAMSQFVEGHWKGQVKIVRNPAPKGRSGVVDMYGNYFEKGYLYP
ncbi:hypothetical protein BBP40_003732 [Aspergillus hancockii]|nr:hypothetical protein BBP40_003732 [Aspergillus hancockii]